MGFAKPQHWRAASKGKIELALAVGDLQIETVSQDGVVVQAKRSGTTLTIALNQPISPANKNSSLRSVVTINYQGQPKQGLNFLPEHQQMYTTFDTGHWLPSVSSPAARASLDLSLILPANFNVVANGVMLSQNPNSDGTITSHWRQTVAMPSYLFGFAGGAFRVSKRMAGGVELRYLTPFSFSEQEVETIFRETAAMLEFYQSKSGIGYPATSYTQVLVSASAAQEVDGFAILSEKYGRRVLADNAQVWLIAHELSHQWWGNQVTNHAWTEFWLNEGVASLLNAAYLEQRYGRARYEKQIFAARDSYLALQAQGLDKPLVFADWDKPSPADRALVYDKGTYVLHLLREELGEQAFWRGIQRYTQDNWGKAVRSQDLQVAMEQASQRDLGDFFRRWIFSIEPLTGKQK